MEKIVMGMVYFEKMFNLWIFNFFMWKIWCFFLNFEISYWGDLLVEILYSVVLNGDLILKGWLNLNWCFIGYMVMVSSLIIFIK